MPINKSKFSKIRALYKRFVESETFKEVYKDKSVGEQIKIEDDKTYKVWFEYRDAADPYDSTTWYHVKYIEEVPDDKIALIKYLEKLLKELK